MWHPGSMSRLALWAPVPHWATQGAGPQAGRLPAGPLGSLLPVRTLGHLARAAHSSKRSLRGGGWNAEALMGQRAAGTAGAKKSCGQGLASGAHGGGDGTQPAHSGNSPRHPGHTPWHPPTKWTPDPALATESCRPLDRLCWTHGPPGDNSQKSRTSHRGCHAWAIAPNDPLPLGATGAEKQWHPPMERPA